MITRGGGFQCLCNPGYVLDEDGYTCSRKTAFIVKWFIILQLSECPAGYYGEECEEKCSCGDLGNTCNHINGSCQCNDCWQGANCSQCKFHFVITDIVIVTGSALPVCKTQNTTYLYKANVYQFLVSCQLNTLEHEWALRCY